MSKIRGWIQHIRNRKFRASVMEEKKKKYLFNKEEGDFQSRRVNFFHKPKNILRPFSAFIRRLQFEHGSYPYSRALGFIGSILILLSVYIIFFSPYFRISPTKVLIEPLDDTIDVNLAYKAVENMYGSFIFSVDPNTIAHNIILLQRQIEKVEVDRLYPNGLKVLISGYPVIFVAQVARLEKEFLLTQNGVLIPGGTVSHEGLQNLEIVSRNLKEELFLEYKQAISQNLLDGILLVRSTFDTEFPHLRYGLFRFFPNERELHITLESGTRILFSLDDTIANTLTNELVTFRIFSLQQGEALNRGGISYIDARTVGKIFLCRDGKICQKNLADIYGDVYK